MTTDHPSPSHGSRQLTVLCYRRAATSPETSLTDQAARVWGWLAANGQQVELFTDRMASTRYTRPQPPEGTDGTATATTRIDPTPAVSSRPTRVAIYQRGSVDDSSLRSYIRAQPGWRFSGLVYRDEQTAPVRRRPQLARALADARSGEFDILLIERLDRLTRHLSVLARILNQLDSAGVTLCSATEPFDTATATGRLLAQIIEVFASHERQDTIARKRTGR
jgi:hypothetical protein